MLGFVSKQLGIDASLFLGKSGGQSIRLGAAYVYRINERLKLIPDFEANLYSEDDPEVLIGSGLSDTEIGARLYYSVNKHVLPYIGVNWRAVFGDTRDMVVEAGEEYSDTRLGLGVGLRY